ncbi:hypothetical protein Agub_g12460 [Astrephomene gubernaculifera]|uniref:RRM domain-containing protein n=1 Tax=Astrephomene gubernaculifera TaxID=47775 RepID=A0AAD3E101_9CHLO|nr:hypothetical protein Agub_g12460 [Astrephomene gubernaculifera]
MATTLGAGMACWPAPQQAVTPGRVLFAKGLAKGCTSAHLQAIFSTFGTVTDCQIARHRSGRSAGFAIVTFLRHEEAVAAMQAIDNLMFMGRRLSVKWFSPERALEGNTHNVDVLNFQALQQALQLSQLQPADLMAQLAQLLDTPSPPQQPQNPHVSAWLDNFVLAQRESPLAPPLNDIAPQQMPFDLLNLSTLSISDIQGPAAGAAPSSVMSSHPATPASMDVSDGAVFVTAGPNLADNKTCTMALAHSRLAKWCAAPGSARAQSSAPGSLADDASTDESASVHASDDSSIATTVQLAPVSCDGPSCCSAGSSPVAPMDATPAACCASATSTPAAPASGNTTSGGASEDPFRGHAPAPTAPGVPSSRPGVVSSDPGTMRRPSAPGFGPAPPVFPGAPALAPLRTAAATHNQIPRPVPRPNPVGPYNSCGGGAAAPADFQQALRLQQALADQARSMNAQQQYMDALAKLAAAREQVAAAASLLNGGSMQMSPTLASPHMQPALMGHMAPPAHPFMAQPPQDLNTLLLLQNAAAMNRPLY